MVVVRTRKNWLWLWAVGALIMGLTLLNGKPAPPTPPRVRVVCSLSNVDVDIRAHLEEYRMLKIDASDLPHDDAEVAKLMQRMAEVTDALAYYETELQALLSMLSREP
jgi:hypothetical protein